MNWIMEYVKAHPLYQGETPSYNNTNCPVFYNIEHCSSYTYGHSCRTCVNYNPLRIILSNNGNNTEIPDEVIRLDAKIQVENFKQ